MKGTTLQKEIDKSIEITVDVRYNPEYNQDEVEINFLDRDGNYTECFMLVQTEPHAGDRGNKYRWIKKSPPLQENISNK